MMVDNLHATEVRDERLDLAARMVARATAAIPAPNAAAKEDLRKAQEFLGRAVVAHMLGDRVEMAGMMSAATQYAASAVGQSGYYDGYPADWTDRLMADA
jgi:threonine dehydrogenase-like Zn-dependent dehydrogenase